MRIHGFPRIALLLSLASVFFSGCGSSFELSDLGDFQIPEFVPSGQSAAPDSPTMIDQTPLALPIDDSAYRAIRHDDPRSVVTGFLESIKRADNHTLRRLLTRKAIEACRENSVQFTIPKAHPLAACRVQYAEFSPSDANAAHVRCFWSNAGDAGAAIEVVVVLRSERLGPADGANDQPVWRIAGMVVQKNEAVDVFSLESAQELASISQR